MTRKKAPPRSPGRSGPRTKRASTSTPTRKAPAAEPETKALARRGRPDTTALALASPAEDLAIAQGFIEDADASETVRAYQHDLKEWASHCERLGAPPFPAHVDAVLTWIASLHREGLSLATIRRRLSALSRAHRDGNQDRRGLDDSRVKRALKGLAKKKGSAPKRKRPVTPDIVRHVLESDDFGLRDRAVMAVGFVTGMRRSELAALRWEHVEQHPDGFVLQIPFSKTDQVGKGQAVAVPYAEDRSLCPARALVAWRTAMMRKNGRTGPVFGCSAQTIYRTVLAAAEACGYDPAEFGGHSLRAGLATTAAEGGVQLGVSMSATRHKSADVAATYVRSTESLRHPAFRAAANSIAGKR